MREINAIYETKKFMEWQKPYTSPEKKAYIIMNTAIV